MLVDWVVESIVFEKRRIFNLYTNGSNPLLTILGLPRPLSQYYLPQIKSIPQNQIIWFWWAERFQISLIFGINVYNKIRNILFPNN